MTGLPLFVWLVTLLHVLVMVVNVGFWAPNRGPDEFRHVGLAIGVTTGAVLPWPDPGHLHDDDRRVRGSAWPAARHRQDALQGNRRPALAQRLAVLREPWRRRPGSSTQPARATSADVLLPDGCGTAPAPRLGGSPLHRRLPVPAAAQRAAPRSAHVAHLCRCQSGCSAPARQPTQLRSPYSPSPRSPATARRWRTTTCSSCCSRQSPC